MSRKFRHADYETTLNTPIRLGEALPAFISRFMEDINPGHKQLDCYTLRSREEYEPLRKVISSYLSTRRSVELALIRHDQPNFFIDGFCAVCGRESKFNTGFLYSCETTEDGKPIPNWREHLACVQCGFINRIGTSMHFLYHQVRPVANAAVPRNLKRSKANKIHLSRRMHEFS